MALPSLRLLESSLPILVLTVTQMLSGPNWEWGTLPQIYTLSSTPPYLSTIERR